MHTLSVWDIDDTLFTSKTNIYVIKNNQIVKKLSTSEYNSYKLRPGEVFDYSEFRDASLFFHNAKPISQSISKVKGILESRNIMLLALTARSDFNDKGLFLQKFKLYGLDMSTPLSHVARSGNLGLPTAAGKKEVLDQCLNTKKFKHTVMFDDDTRNLDAFLSLQASHKNITFRAYAVHKGKIVPYG